MFVETNTPRRRSWVSVAWYWAVVAIVVWLALAARQEPDLATNPAYLNLTTREAIERGYIQTTPPTTPDEIRRYRARTPSPSVAAPNP
jgi:hypothetical protein